MNEELKLATIISTPDGSGLATKGKELEEKWNSNANKTSSHINAIWAALLECVTSQNIVAIRINNTTGKAEYTFDPVDGSEEWHLLSGIEWADLLGDPMKSSSLAVLLNSKSSLERVEELSTLITAVSNTVDAHTAELAVNAAEIDNHEERITNVEKEQAEMGLDLANKVNMNPGDFITIKWNQDTNNLDFSVDGGVSYKPIMSSIDWADLKGKPNDNIEFTTYIHDLVGFIIDDPNFGSISETVHDWITELQTAINNELVKKVNTDLFDKHVNDTNNPHNVTKALIGLDQVENLNPYDLPISNATMEAINAIQAKDISFDGLKGFKVVDRLSYDNALNSGDLNLSALYFVSRHNTGVPAEKVYKTVNVSINSVGSGYVSGDILTYQLDTNLVIRYDGGNNIVVLQEGMNKTNFAGIGVPIAGGSGNGFTIDITTEYVEE